MESEEIINELENQAKNEPLVLDDIDREGIFEEHMMQMGFRCLNSESGHDVYACTPKIAYEFHQHARELQRQDSSGPGTMEGRFRFFLDMLSDMLPNNPLAAEPPEHQYLREIRRLLVRVRALD